MRSAKELCAMLITRGIKTLTEDEEDVVVDYLDDLGVEAELDDSPKQLCMKLLDEVMMKDVGRRVPISAYANSLISEQKKKSEESIMRKQQREEQRRRRNKEIDLENKMSMLPGCVPDDTGLFSKTLYDLVVDPEVGISQLSDNQLQYAAEVAVNQDVYREIFLNLTNPVLEITTSQGDKGYAKITSTHSDASNVIYISPLVGSILNINERGGGTVRLCIAIPYVKKINFTYYGDQESLNNVLEPLISKLPGVINAFSYLSLGMLLRTTINNEEVIVRVDRLEDAENDPIFVGIIQPGESDLPFDIEADK